MVVEEKPFRYLRDRIYLLVCNLNSNSYVCTSIPHRLFQFLRQFVCLRNAIKSLFLLSILPICALFRIRLAVSIGAKIKFRV